MLKVESLKDYYEANSKKLDKVNDELFALFDIASKKYPGHESWYICKQLRETALSNKRDILFIRSDVTPFKIIAMACLKNTLEEKKICTFYISPEYRKPDIYAMLIRECLCFLKTAWPLITINSDSADMLTPLIDKYNWKLTEVLPDYYQNGLSELCFNGYLTPLKRAKEKFPFKLGKLFNKKIEYTK